MARNKIYYIKWICICKNNIYLVKNITLLLNSILTGVSRICKRLPQKHTADLESYKIKLHQSCKDDATKIEEKSGSIDKKNWGL